MTTVRLTNGTDVETGCWVSSWWGQYGADHLIDQACSVLDIESEVPTRDPGPSDDPDGSDPEITIDYADELERRLNELTPEGFAWGWWEGEFWLWSDEEWRQNG